MARHVSDDLVSLRTFIRAVSGGAAGSFSMFLLFPLETVRTRLQVDDNRESSSTLHCILEIVGEEGVSSLFRGCWSLIVSLFVTNFVYFYVFHALRLYLVSVSDVDQTAGNDLLFGIIAGAAAVLLSNPLWVVNTRLKLQGVNLNSTKSINGQRSSPVQNNSGIIDCLINIVKREGPFVLWSGLFYSLVLVLNPAINFMVYETLKRTCLLTLKNWVNLSAIFFAFGAMSKLVATVATYPLQLFQTRIRAGLAMPDLSHNSFWYRVRFLYRGMEAKLMQTVLNSAVMLMSYESIDSIVVSLFTLSWIED